MAVGASMKHICTKVCLAVVLVTARVHADEPAPTAESAQVESPEPWREGLPGPWRASVNLGLPELLGVGIGRTLAAGHLRVQVEVGSVLVFLFSATMHVQGLVYRYKWLTTGLGIHGGWMHNPDLNFSGSSGEEPRSWFVGGARAIVEVVPIRRWQHLGFALEGGVLYGKDPTTVGSPWQPAAAFRVFLAWGD